MNATLSLHPLNDFKVIKPENIDEFSKKGHTLISNVLSAEEINAYRPVIVNAAEKYNTEKRKMEDRDTYGKAFLQIMNLWRCDEGVRQFVLSKRLAKIAADLMGAGIHLFVEKPLADTAAGAAALARQAEKAGIVLQVGHIERFSPAFRELAARVGTVRSIEAVRHAPWNGRSTDVDVVLDLMIHDIDLVLALVRQPVVSVEARGSVVRTAGKALNRLEELAVEAAGSAPVDIAVAHLASPDRAAALAERLTERMAAGLDGRPVHLGEIGAVLGAHVGPGMVAVCVSRR